MITRNYSMKSIDCQEIGDVLEDVSSTGRERDWNVKKIQNSYLGLIYKEIDNKKAERLKECASFLIFNKVEQGLKLKKANFCRVRLCPICQWRRSLKVYNQLRLVTDMALENNYQFIFVTLTLRNCKGEKLSETLDKILLAFNRMMNYKDLDKAFKGYFRSLEVTHNVGDDSYHPHIHTMIAVNKSYFSSKSYISQEKLRQLWQKALKVDYEPQVDIRKIKSKSAKALAEVAKYAVKASDMIYFDDWQLSVDTVRTLDRALNNRRFIGMGGVLKEYHKILNLTDAEDDADLINVNEEDKPEELAENELIYAWLSGYNQYRQVGLG